MATTFVGIGGRGFWVSDSLLELWLRLLALHLEEPGEDSSLAARIRNGWLLASRGLFMGCVPDGLEEAVSSPEREALVRAAISSLMAALGAAPQLLNKDVLNLLGIEGTFTADVETRKLLEVGQAWVRLLDGKVTTGPADAPLLPEHR